MLYPYAYKVFFADFSLKPKVLVSLCFRGTLVSFLPGIANGKQTHRFLGFN